MNIVAQAILLAFALFLLGATAVTFSKPAIIERFFMTLANSASAHYTEQAVRLLVGIALVVASPRMWQAKLFWFAGWMIIVSSIALIVTPWRWHSRFGEKIRPAMIKHMKAYAVGVFGFGIFLLYGLLAGNS